MKLRVKVLLSSMAVLAAVAVTSLFLLRGTLLVGFNTLDHEHADRDLNRAATAFSEEGAALESTAHDYAAWDRTYEYVVTRDPGYVHSEMTDETFRTIRVQVFALLDRQGREVVSKALDTDGAAPSHLIATLRSRNLLFGLEAGDSGSRGLVVLPDGAYLVAVRSIVTSEMRGPSRGTLVMARRLNWSELARIGNLCGNPVDGVPLRDVRDPEYQAARADLVADGRAVRSVGPDRIVGFLLLRDIWDTPAFVLKVDSGREILGLGRTEIQRLMLVMFGSLLLMMMVSAGAFEVIGVRRIARLARFFDCIESAQSLAERVPASGRDEIAVLSKSFNRMLARLQHAHEDLVTAQEKLRFEAEHDPLTGLLNRAASLEVLAAELARSERTRETAAVMLIDVDHFKTVNDTLGHDAGDQVLIGVAQAMRSAIRPYDFGGRYGGDEMLVIAPGCDEQRAAVVAERIRAAISEVRTGSRVRVGASIGVAVNGFAETPQALIARADQAMYAAKHRGRGCVMIASLPASVEVASSAVPAGAARTLAAFTLLALLFGSFSVRAQEPVPPGSSTSGPTWSSAVQVMNNYVWRGFLVNDRPVMQPEVRLSWKGAELSTWSNLVAEDRTLRYYEHDLALNYEHSLRGRWSWNTGYTYYAFVQDTTDRYQHEFSLGASFDGPVYLGFTAFQTVAPIYGTYYALEAGRTFQPRRRPPLILRGSLGYNHRLWIPASLFSDATLTASTRFSAKQLRLEPLLSFSAGLDRRWFGRHLTFGLRISRGEAD